MQWSFGGSVLRVLAKNSYSFDSCRSKKVHEADEVLLIERPQLRRHCAKFLENKTQFFLLSFLFGCEIEFDLLQQWKYQKNRTILRQKSHIWKKNHNQRRILPLSMKMRFRLFFFQANSLKVMGNIAKFASEMTADALSAAGGKMLDATSKLTTGLGGKKVKNSLSDSCWAR